MSRTPSTKYGCNGLLASHNIQNADEHNMYVGKSEEKEKVETFVTYYSKAIEQFDDMVEKAKRWKKKMWDVMLC
eukprot:2909754-Ditylum_brightwellii.AAC.1